MSAKSAGRVLNNMDPETAASLSTSFSRLGD
jgi:flagellar motility protein MotE (MotC chaperone)